MKIEITLILLFNLLFLNNVYAKSDEATACQSALEKGDVATALTITKNALITNKNDRDLLICQGRSLAANDDLNSALNAFQQADAQAIEPLDKAITSMLIGNTYKLLKQYDKAITSYQSASAQAKISKIPSYERASYNAIGNVHALNQQYAQALAQYELGSKLAANDNERGESFEKIALIHHKMQQHDLALEYQVKGYAMQSKSGSLDEQANAGIVLGQYYALTKSYTSAEHILNKMIKLAVDNGGAYYEGKASYVLAGVKQAIGDKESARQLLDRAKAIAKETQDKDLEAELQQQAQNFQ